MHPHEAGPTDPTPAPGRKPPEAVSTPAGRSTEAPLSVQASFLVLAAALTAGAASWLVGERTHNLYQPSNAAASEKYAFAELNRQTARANGLNGAIVFGTLGGLLGVGMGLAAGLSRRSVGGAVAGAAAGLVLGTLTGALPALVIMPWQWTHRHDDPTSVTLVPILVHCGLWAGLGVAAGLAFGLGRPDPKPAMLVRVALGGLAGALVGTVAYEVLVALAFPTTRTDEAFPVGATARLLPHVCVAAFTAIGVILFAAPPRRPAKTTA